jgi:hypothetical protein
MARQSSMTERRRSCAIPSGLPREGMTLAPTFGKMLAVLSSGTSR